MHGSSSARIKHTLLALVGDSEFESGEVQTQLEHWGWSYALRQKPSTMVACAE
jgi:hypothetical protein